MFRMSIIASEEKQEQGCDGERSRGYKQNEEVVVLSLWR